MRKEKKNDERARNDAKCTELNDEEVQQKHKHNLDQPHRWLVRTRHCLFCRGHTAYYHVLSAAT